MPIRNIVVHFAAGAALATMAQELNAQIGYISQERKVTASVGPSYLTFEKKASDFGPFKESISHTLTDLALGPFLVGFGKASQHSSLTSTSMVFEGACGGIDGYGSGGAGAGIGKSSFDVHFGLAVAQPFTFTYDFKSSGSNSGSFLLFWLKGPEGTIFKFDLPSLAKGTLVGTLAPGKYEFNAWFQDGYQGYSTGAGFGSFSTALFIPSPSASPVLLALVVHAVSRRRRSALNASNSLGEHPESSTLLSGHDHRLPQRPIRFAQRGARLGL